MDTKLKDLWEKVKGFFTKLNKKIKILLGVALGVLLLVLLMVAYSVSNRPYAVLFTGLSATETSSVMSYLETNGIVDYQVQGDSIMVPEGQEDLLKAKLAMQGYPKSGFLYESYFNNVSSMSTTSERETALRIATEQRLESTIACLDGVKNAYVQINPGKDQTYVLDDTSKVSASAAVTLEMHDGAKLSKEAASAIRLMVTHSVQGLSVENVSISDTLGNTYSTQDSVSSLSDGSALKLQLEEETNNSIRTNVMQILSDIYGPGNVRVAVNSTVDVNRKIVESTEYSQPEGANSGAGLIGRETWLQQVVKENTDAVGGVVGTTTNSDIPTYVQNELEVNGDENYVGSSGDREYDNNKSTTQMEVIAGTVTDVKVSVTINRNSSTASAVSTETLINHIAMAAGIGGTNINPEDYISVVIAPFYTESNDLSVLNPEGVLPDWVLYAAIGGGVLCLILFLVILLLLRRNKKKKQAQAAEEARLAEEQRILAESSANLADTTNRVAANSDSGADIMDLNMEKSMELRKTVRQFTQANPEIAALIIKTWLRGEDD